MSETTMLTGIAATDELTGQLQERFDRDQAARISGDSARIAQSDRENVAWLRAVIRRHGWPGIALVGREGSTQAWLMALHADKALIFQRQCLELLIEAVDQGEAEAWQIAYLTDRVLMHLGEPQRYGTQFRRTADGWEPLPVVEPENIDVRRAALGLPPTAEAGVFNLPPRLRD
jgi:hypothetical protein